MYTEDTISSTLAPSGAVRQPNLDEKSKLRLQRAIQDFESIFVGYLLKSMRSSIPKNEKEGDNFGGEMMEGLFDLELAKHISRSRSFGVAEMMYKQLTGESMPKKTVTPAPPGVNNIPPSTVGQPAPVAGATMRKRIEALNEIIDDAAQEHELDANLLKAVIATESAGKVDARSNRNAKGLMQLIDSTATAMGVQDVWDPRENIFGGAKYLRQMLDRFDGDLRLALASYNAGPAAVEKHRGIPPFHETRNYVTRVMNYLRYFQSQELFSHDEQ